MSKVFHLISRFSEDIDLILDWRVLRYSRDEPWEKRSNTKQDAFNKEANARAEVFLAETFCPAIKEGLSQELGREADIHMDEEEKQTVIFSYPKQFSNGGTLQACWQSILFPCMTKTGQILVTVQPPASLLRNLYILNRLQRGQIPSWPNVHVLMDFAASAKS